MKVWTGKTAELEIGATLAVLMRRRMRALKEGILMRAGVVLLLITVKADCSQLFTKLLHTRNPKL